MSASAETLSLLSSIDDSLKSIDAQLRMITRHLVAAAPKPIASDKDLDGKYGDPLLKFTPRDWTGQSFKNARFSQCPPELLDQVAESLDYFAMKAEETDERTSGGKPVAEFRRADAARARGWAKRKRDAGETTQEPQPASAWATGEPVETSVWPTGTGF